MARKTRIHYPGAFYHVMLRGNAKQNIFHGQDDTRRFEEILGESLERYNLRLFAYCWMKSHLHMVLQVSDIALSKMMQSLSQRYTGWFNHRYDRVGHLFQGRYKAILVDREGYLLEVIRYIHLNPVRAEFVADPLDYPESSHRSYLTPEKAPSWLFIDSALKLFGQTMEAAQARYLYFMGQPIEADRLQLLKKGGTEGRILGDEDFVHKALTQSGEVCASTISLEALTVLVAQKYNIPHQEIISNSRTKLAVKARAVLALLAFDYNGHTLKEVSEYLGREMSTMSRHIRSVRDKRTKFFRVQEEITGFIEEISKL